MIGQSSELIPLHTWVIDDSECLSRTILSVSDVSGEYFLVHLSTKSALSRAKGYILPYQTVTLNVCDMKRYTEALDYLIACFAQSTRRGIHPVFFSQMEMAIWKVFLPFLFGGGRVWCFSHDSWGTHTHTQPQLQWTDVVPTNPVI